MNLFHLTTILFCLSNLALVSFSRSYKKIETSAYKLQLQVKFILIVFILVSFYFFLVLNLCTLFSQKIIIKIPINLPKNILFKPDQTTPLNSEELIVLKNKLFIILKQIFFTNLKSQLFTELKLEDTTSELNRLNEFISAYIY